MHGRFRVESDQGNGWEFMTTGEGRPLRDLSKLGREEETVSAEEAISPAQFKSEISAELSRNSGCISGSVEPKPRHPGAFEALIKVIGVA